LTQKYEKCFSPWDRSHGDPFHLILARANELPGSIRRHSAAGRSRVSPRDRSRGDPCDLILARASELPGSIRRHSPPGRLRAPRSRLRGDAFHFILARGNKSPGSVRRHSPPGRSRALPVTTRRRIVEAQRGPGTVRAGSPALFATFSHRKSRIYPHGTGPMGTPVISYSLGGMNPPARYAATRRRGAHARPAEQAPQGPH